MGEQNMHLAPKMPAMPVSELEPARQRANPPGLEAPAWRRWFSANALQRWNLRRLKLGFTLDVGCGIGRQLMHLDGNGLGVSQDPETLLIARQRGLLVMAPGDFARSDYANRPAFDSIVVAHVLEHMRLADASDLLRGYLRSLRPGGRMVLITPQEAGYGMDKSHLEFMNFERLLDLFTQLGLECERTYSFPLPRFAGRHLAANEFVAIGRKPL